jgi:hypothetical protein
MSETFIVSITSTCNEGGAYRAVRRESAEVVAAVQRLSPATEINGTELIVRNLAEIGIGDGHLLWKGFHCIAVWNGETLEGMMIAYVLENPRLTVVQEQERREVREFVQAALSLGATDKRAITRVSLDFIGQTAEQAEAISEHDWALLLYLPPDVTANFPLIEDGRVILTLMGDGLPDYCRCAVNERPVELNILIWHFPGGGTKFHGFQRVP